MPRIPSVVSAAEANAIGLSRHAIRHRLDRGFWKPMMRGIYLTHNGTASDADWERAALLFARTSHAMISGAAGLRRHGLTGPHPGPPLLVLVPTGCSRQSAGPVTIRHTDKVPDRILYHPRIAVARVARCVIDACIDSRDLQAVRHTVATAVQRGRCSVEDLFDEIENVTRRGTGAVRTALAEVGMGARSVAEAEVAVMLHSAGIHGFRQNVAVTTESGIWLACADFYWRELRAVLEIDSREWHLDPASWQATLTRHNRLVAAGFAVLHCSPAQIRRDPEGFLCHIRSWLEERHDQFRLKPPITGSRRN